MPGMKVAFVATAAGMSAYIGASISMFWGAALAAVAALCASYLYDEIS